MILAFRGVSLGSSGLSEKLDNLSNLEKDDWRGREPLSRMMKRDYLCNHVSLPTNEFVPVELRRKLMYKTPDATDRVFVPNHSPLCSPRPLRNRENFKGRQLQARLTHQKASPNSNADCVKLQSVSTETLIGFLNHLEVG